MLRGNTPRSFCPVALKTDQVRNSVLRSYWEWGGGAARSGVSVEESRASWSASQIGESSPSSRALGEWLLASEYSCSLGRCLKVQHRLVRMPGSSWRSLPGVFIVPTAPAPLSSLQSSRQRLEQRAEDGGTLPRANACWLSQFSAVGF